LTAFKRISEFAICAALLGSIGLLWVHRERFDRDVLRLLVAALAVMVASEVCFTLYSSPMGTWNFAGHYLKILAFFLIYLAIIETGLQRPYQLLFRNLASSEAAARESEERYRTLVEQSPRAILVHTGGKYVFANAAAAKLFGAADAQRLVGRDTLDLVAPEDRERIGAAVQQAYASHSSGMGQCSILRLDGQRVPVESVRAAVMYQGRPAIQVILEDITERKAVEQALLEAKRAAEEANQAKDNFLATLSHELRTPLTPVLAAASILKDDASLPEQARHDLEMMRRNVELQARLIDDLLDLTRIARGKLELSLRTVNVHELLEHAIDICRSDAYAKEIKLVPELHAEQAHVLADSSRLQQVFWNLVKNAIKFTPPGGKIWVRTSNKETGSGTGRPVVVIEVQDTGMGIEPEDLGRIFNAFEQGGRTITRRFGGLGLGLAICKAIAELHRGSIRASSLGRDKGATLTVEVCTVEAPAAQVGGAAGMPASAAGASGRPLRILLVEDHGDTAYLMSRLLERLNHAVATASSIQGAMTAAQAGGFDLVISDLGLPDGSGLDLMRQLKQMYGLRGICLSGYGTEKDIQASREAGFVQHLVKPVDFQNLRAAIQQVADIG
jgi:two-component system CheB/CheR fusion protein